MFPGLVSCGGPYFTLRHSAVTYSSTLSLLLFYWFCKKKKSFVVKFVITNALKKLNDVQLL